MILILYTIILIYCIFILALIYGFSKTNSFELNGLTPKTQFSILVPFRDESENLPILLRSFSDLNYPTDLFEVILIDDDSAFKFPISNYDFQISMIDSVRASNSPKKDAITTAVEFANSEWILTTDADCIVHKDWLRTLDNYIQKQGVSMIAGAVSYDCGDSFLHHFQQLDFTSLQGVTIGSFGLGKGFMCNGANFAYKKSFFKEIEGFNGNDQIASGDDVFLLQKAIALFPKKVHYLMSKSTIVRTKPLTDWKMLFHQRVRWVSKTVSFQSVFGIGLGLVVFLTNATWLFLTGSLLFGLISYQTVFVFSFLKFSVEIILVYKTNQFLTNKKLHYLFMGVLYYPFFSTGVVLYSLFGKYEWKGRRFKY